MNFNLTILGSNSALPKINRFSTAQILNISERFFLIDCGEGTQIQLRRYQIKFSKINHIFISHLHGDHIYGLPGLISTFNLLGRKSDLHIYSHSDLEPILSFLLTNIERNLQFKIVYHQTNTKEKTIIYEDKKVIVEAFPLKHKIPTTGFIFREKQQLQTLIKEKIEFYQIPISKRKEIKDGANFTTSEGKTIKNSELTLKTKEPRSYAFCSDTQFSEKTAKYVENINVLYHEATFLENLKIRAKETMHSTAKDAATVAKMAQVKLLLIGHFSSRYNNLDAHLTEAKKVFENTVTATDGFTLSI
jgi:ribonuclease Z